MKGGRGNNEYKGNSKFMCNSSKHYMLLDYKKNKLR